MSQGKFMLASLVVCVLCLAFLSLDYGLAHAGKPIKPRFSVLPGDPAWVLDTTTALQWQKAPNGEPMPKTNADAYCSSLGNGSRLPEVKELISLLDYSQGPALPAGHPFQDVITFFHFYWSATPQWGGSGFFWLVSPNSGEVVVSVGVPITPRAWCVR